MILIGPLDAEKIAEGGFLYVSTISLNLDKLNERKNTLCLKFAKDAFKLERFRTWFVLRKSALPYVIHLLNK